jgi:hypothetical protein
LPRPFCAQTCATPAACEAARVLADDEYVQRTLSRTVLSIIDEPSALDRLWDDLTVVIRARRPVRVPERDLLRAFVGHGSDWYATRRGVQGVWTYGDTGVLRDQLRELLMAKLQTGSAPAAAVDAFRSTVQRLHGRQFDPYPACNLVCKQDPPLCLYRSAVADLVTSRRYQDSWNEADERDRNDTNDRRKQTWEVCQDAAFELVEFPDDDMPEAQRAPVELAARRVCMCFEQQMLADDHRKVPRTTRRILARVLAEAGL